MITTVNWQYIILNGDTSGWRVKRRKGGPPPVYSSGTDSPMMDDWTRAAPPSILYSDGRTYLFVFWSLTAYDSQSLQSSAQIQTSTVANDSQTGGQWTINAKAYYYWNFGNGGGDNALLIDAFDVQLGDFIPDDFVDAKPDPTGTLTVEANNGYIDTTTEIPNGTPPPTLTVSARNLLPSSKKFLYWLYWPSIAPFFYSQDPAYPATVGTPNPQDIVVHYNDTVVAIGMYTDVKHVVIPQSIYNPWWWVATHWGLVPPEPEPWWSTQYRAAVSLANAARGLSPQLQAKVLEIALEQMSLAATTLKQQIEGLQQK